MSSELIGILKCWCIVQGILKEMVYVNPSIFANLRPKLFADAYTIFK